MNIHNFASELSWPHMSALRQSLKQCSYHAGELRTRWWRWKALSSPYKVLKVELRGIVLPLRSESQRSSPNLAFGSLSTLVHVRLKCPWHYHQVCLHGLQAGIPVHSRVVKDHDLDIMKGSTELMILIFWVI